MNFMSRSRHRLAQIRRRQIYFPRQLLVAYGLQLANTGAAMKRSVLGVLVFAAAGSLAACSESNNGGSGPSAGGQGGSSPSTAGSTGNAGSGAGGNPNSGGNGNANGGNANGGNNPDGNAGTSNGGDSGNNSGGNAGASNGGMAGESNGGNGPGGTAGASNGGTAGTGNGGNAGGPGGLPYLEECFNGLRGGTGTYQDATKNSADGLYSFRLALETADRFGTSGTRPWGAYRFGLVTPDGSVCVTEEAPLVDAYQVSHHNCEDVFTWTQGDLRYEVEHPDTAVDRPSSLTIYEGQTVVAGPIRLDLAECHFSSLGECSSGGPCGVVLDQ